MNGDQNRYMKMCFFSISFARNFELFENPSYYKDKYKNIINILHSYVLHEPIFICLYALSFDGQKKKTTTDKTKSLCNVKLIGCHV